MDLYYSLEYMALYKSILPHNVQFYIFRFQKNKKLDKLDRKFYIHAEDRCNVFLIQ